LFNFLVHEDTFWSILVFSSKKFQVKSWPKNFFGHDPDPNIFESRIWIRSKIIQMCNTDYCYASGNELLTTYEHTFLYRLQPHSTVELGFICEVLEQADQGVLCLAESVRETDDDEPDHEDFDDYETRVQGNPGKVEFCAWPNQQLMRMSQTMRTLVITKPVYKVFQERWSFASGKVSKGN
jgi:hypothetical protein